MDLGLKGVREYTVTPELTARSLGSGALPVFGTPFLVAMMEGACVRAVTEALPEGKSTVGVEVNVSHVSASPIGMKVWAQAELIHVSENGKMLTFHVSAYDEKGLIGEGTHVRAIISNERFMQKTEAKLQ